MYGGEFRSKRESVYRNDIGNGSIYPTYDCDSIKMLDSL